MPSLTTSQKVAIAVSVPLVAVVIYVVLRWVRENEDFDDVEEEEEQFATSSDLVLEVRVAQEHIGAVIGRGGSTIKQIQKESQTRINLKDDNEEEEVEEEDEKKRMRTILVRGSRERTKHAEVLVRKVIAEQPAVETSTMEVPQKAIGRVIGKGGTTIRQLSRISGELKFTCAVHTAKNSATCSSIEGWRNNDVTMRLSGLGSVEYNYGCLNLLEYSKGGFEHVLMLFCIIYFCTFPPCALLLAYG